MRIYLLFVVVRGGNILVERQKSCMGRKIGEREREGEGE